METRAHIGQGGRIVIPSKMRKQLQVQVGDEVVLQLRDDVLQVMSVHAAVRRAQALIRRHVPQDRSLSRELLDERREEARHE